MLAEASAPACAFCPSRPRSSLACLVARSSPSEQARHRPSRFSASKATRSPTTTASTGRPIPSAATRSISSALAIEPSYRVNDWLQLRRGDRVRARRHRRHRWSSIPSRSSASSRPRSRRAARSRSRSSRRSSPSGRRSTSGSGRLYVPVGLTSSHDEPDEYFTNTRHETEVALIPTLWHETGVGVFGALGRARYQALLVNGPRRHRVQLRQLDRRRLAEALRAGQRQRARRGRAGSTSMSTPSSYRSASRATSATAPPNRPKADLDVPANVGIVEAHAVVERGPFKARGLLLYGRLQNSGVGLRRQPQPLQQPQREAHPGGERRARLVRRGRLRRAAAAHRRRRAGRAARGSISSPATTEYDSMYGVAPGVFDNPRWERQVVTAGSQLADPSRPSWSRASTPTAPSASPPPTPKTRSPSGFGLIYGE